MRKSDTLAHTIIKGPVEGKRGRGRPKRKWSDDLKEWSRREVHGLKKLTKETEKLEQGN